MRPIDADRLEQELLSTHKRVADNAGAEPTWFQTGICVGLEHAALCVSKVPMVEAEPVRHGEWLESESGYSETETIFCCSWCKNEFIVQKGDRIDFNYCPNCGAKMEGGEKI